MPALYERLLGRVPVEHVGRNVQAVLPVDERGATERVYWLAKRLIDIVLSAVGLDVLALLIPLVALANAIFSRGPLFYRQVRVGRGGKNFAVVKFRTMRPDAEQDTGAVWAQAGDVRVTPAGRWLRKTRLDELPQVLNVLRGEMSLIGPRPERPEFVDDLARQIPFYRARLSAKPGLTGWAQVRFGYGNSVDDARTKLEYDLYYVRHASFNLDALIVLKTIGVMLRLQGK
jgi:lipopolysaccharide/colanic/teichoic acid biosynthesis glycosyltransferase